MTRSRTHSKHTRNHDGMQDRTGTVTGDQEGASTTARYADVQVYLWSPFKGRRFVLAHRATVSEKPLSNKLFCSAVLLGRGRGICCRCAMRAAGWSWVSLPPVRTSPGNASNTHTCSMQHCVDQSCMHCCLPLYDCHFQFPLPATHTVLDM